MKQYSDDEIGKIVDKIMDKISVIFGICDGYPKFNTGKAKGMIRTTISDVLQELLK